MGRGKERRIYLAKGPGEGRIGGVSTVRAYIVGKKPINDCSNGLYYFLKRGSDGKI